MSHVNVLTCRIYLPVDAAREISLVDYRNRSLSIGVIVTSSETRVISPSHSSRESFQALTPPRVLSLGIQISDSVSTRSILRHPLTLVSIKFSIKSDGDDGFMFLQVSAAQWLNLQQPILHSIDFLHV